MLLHYTFNAYAFRVRRDFIHFITIIIIDISKYLLLFFFCSFRPLAAWTRTLAYEGIRFSLDANFNKTKRTNSPSLMAHVHYRFPSKPTLSFHCEQGSGSVRALFVHFHCFAALLVFFQNDVVVRCDWLSPSDYNNLVIVSILCARHSPDFRIREHRHSGCI